MVVNIVNMYDKPRANPPHGHKISPLQTSRTTDNFFRLPQSKPADKIFLSLRWTTHKKCAVWLHDSLLPGGLFLHVNGAMKKTKQQGCGKTVQVPSEYHRLCKRPAVLWNRVKRKIRSVVQVALHLPKSGHNGYPRSQSWDVHLWFPAAMRFSSLNRSNMVRSTKTAHELSFFWNNCVANQTIFLAHRLIWKTPRRVICSCRFLDYLRFLGIVPWHMTAGERNK